MCLKRVMEVPAKAPTGIRWGVCFSRIVKTRFYHKSFAQYRKLYPTLTGVRATVYMFAQGLARPEI